MRDFNIRLHLSPVAFIQFPWSVDTAAICSATTKTTGSCCRYELSNNMWQWRTDETFCVCVCCMQCVVSINERRATSNNQQAIWYCVACTIQIHINLILWLLTNPFAFHFYCLSTCDWPDECEWPMVDVWRVNLKKKNYDRTRDTHTQTIPCGWRTRAIPCDCIQLFCIWAPQAMIRGEEHGTNCDQTHVKFENEITATINMCAIMRWPALVRSSVIVRCEPLFVGISISLYPPHPHSVSLSLSSRSPFVWGLNALNLQSTSI